MDLSAIALQIAFMLREERLGRRRLAKRVGLGEMAVRLELDRLREAGLVHLDRAGCRLSPKGVRAFRPFLDPVRKLIPVDLAELRMDEAHVAAHLAMGLDGPSAWALRDAGIRAGATGLISLTRIEDEWAFSHNGEPIRAQNPRDAEQLSSRFPNPAPGDSLLLSAGPDLAMCTSGMWTVIRTLYEKP